VPSGKQKILLIDDEKDFCHLLKLNLEEQGPYEVLVATDPRVGIRVAHQRRPDVILLDIVMPGMRGFEVLEKLKADRKTLSIPVLMLSALNDGNSKQQAISRYVDGYIEKPVNMDLLKSRIEGSLVTKKVKKGQGRSLGRGLRILRAFFKQFLARCELRLIAPPKA